jgi:transposase
MAAHPDITHVSRDRGTEYASAASTGAPQEIQVAERSHLCQNLSDAVQRLLARVLSEMKAASQEAEAEASAQKEASVAVLEWRPDPGAQVARTIAIRRVERDARYQLAVHLREGERLDIWLTRVQGSCIPELSSVAHGVEQDKAAVRAGLTLPINKGQTVGHVTRMKRDLAYEVLHGKGLRTSRQRVLHRI